MKTQFSKEIISRGIKLMVNKSVILFNKPIKLDMRFTENKKVVQYMKLHPITHDERMTILSKRKKRQLNQPIEFKNVLQNSILLDFQKHGGNVYCDRINVYGRNHWAKKPIDFKVLSILMKNQYKQRLSKAI